MVAEARLEVYFNCPLSAATLEVDLDGEALARKQLNYYTKGFLGIKKKGAGVYQEVFTVRSGDRNLSVRLRDEAGSCWRSRRFRRPWWRVGGRS